jgi:fructose-1,6-bisphosphatase/inositol monophosphatase family enzyme
LIALVKNEKIIGGVIDCPALQERWMSFDTDTTIVNGNSTKCREIDKLENSVMATTSSHEFGMEKWRAYQSLEESVKVTTTGSDCYNYGLLASGYLDIVAEKLTAPHDYLPLIKIVQGAGGIMTDWEGNNLNFSDKNVYVLASSSKELHELALEKLRAE